MTITDQPATEAVPPPPQSDDSSGGMIGTALFALAALGILAMIAGLIALAFVALFNDDSGGDGGSSATASDLDISLTEFAIEGELSAPAGNVTLNVVNAGAIEHNLEVRELGIGTANLASRGLESLPLGELEPGSYELFCSIAGHETSGMAADLVITDADSFAPAELSSGDAHEGLTADEMDALMVDSMLAFPAETEGVGNVPLEPEIAEDGAKVFRLTAEIVPWEVEPGKFVDAWAYNGMVPGPAIKVQTGDLVRVEVDNQLPMGTDVHWHGIQTPNEMDGVAPITQPLIESGETFTYEFVAQKSAVGMYHAHHHAQMQVPNGMFGAFLIDDVKLPEGQTIAGVQLPDEITVAQEIPMVLNDAGVIGYSLNGKSFPATAPYVVDQDDWILIHYYNEGLQIHPMHMHQFPQLIVAKDGIPLDYPYYADTINVAPGERYTVLVNPNDPGTWVWHCHILTHVERDEGMFGMVTAVVVQ